MQIITKDQSGEYHGVLPNTMMLGDDPEKLENPASTKNSNTHCTWLHRNKPFVNVAKCARDQCSIFSMVQYFDRTTLRFLLELHALTLAAHSYAIL